MTIYTLRSFASSGRIVAVQRIPAKDDEEALSMARDMVKGPSAVARVDLRQGERCIEGSAPTAKEKSRRSETTGSPRTYCWIEEFHGRDESHFALSS